MHTHQRGGPSSSRSHQYPAHLSALDLEAMAPSQEENDASIGFGGGGSSHSIHRGVEYKVNESDHAKYYARYKNFGNGCEWLIHLSLRTRKGFWE
ncbi:hypothetical protein PIB30_070970, partial [Stylosanthes scabra]|nr:hypothetical protein [Stylosanthes scabra]